MVNLLILASAIHYQPWSDRGLDRRQYKQLNSMMLLCLQSWNEVEAGIFIFISIVKQNMGISHSCPCGSQLTAKFKTIKFIPRHQRFRTLVVIGHILSIHHPWSWNVPVRVKWRHRLVLFIARKIGLQKIGAGISFESILAQSFQFSPVVYQLSDEKV